MQYLIIKLVIILQVDEILKKYNLKNTKQRSTVLKFFMSNDKPTTITAILDFVKSEGLEIDISTIYRTCDKLCQFNIIEKVYIDNKEYGYILKGNNHKHIVKCIACKKDIEIECPIEEAYRILKIKNGIEMNYHCDEASFDIICKECNTKTKGDLNHELQ